jgi:hypothetical protein
MPRETRLNTISVAVIACISLVYICTFINFALALAAFFSVVPLYWFVQRNHARYAFLEKIWYLGGAWKYVFPFVLYLLIGELVQGLLVGYDAHYHIYVACKLRTVIVGGILVRYRSLYTELTDRKFYVPALLAYRRVNLCAVGGFGRALSDACWCFKPKPL